MVFKLKINWFQKLGYSLLNQFLDSMIQDFNFFFGGGGSSGDKAWIL